MTGCIMGCMERLRWGMVLLWSGFKYMGRRRSWGWELELIKTIKIG